MDEPPVRPGDVLAGKYQVDRQLGAGGMGVVLAAHQLGLDRTVAVKLMLPGKLTQPDAQARFVREARATVRLKSQHIAKVFDVGTIETGAPYIVFEYLEGTDLGALLQRRGPLPVAEAVEYVLQACEAVAEAHAAGIVHRDLKPSNLFLTDQADGSPCVKVLDFGISKEVATNLQLTREKQAMGSPLYMSPEQMESAKGVDARSDIWAVGVLLYELVAGVTPFHAETLEQLYGRVLLGRPRPLSSVRPGLPSALEAAILRCLEKDRDQRWPTIAAFAAALAPIAPPRALPYVDRIAAVLRAEVRGSQPGATPASAAGQGAQPASSVGTPVPAFGPPPPLPAGVLAAHAERSPVPIAPIAGATHVIRPSPSRPDVEGTSAPRRRIAIAALTAAALASMGLGAALWLYVVAPLRTPEAATTPDRMPSASEPQPPAPQPTMPSDAMRPTATPAPIAPASASAPATSASLSAAAPAPQPVPTARAPRTPAPSPKPTANPYQRK